MQCLKAMIFPSMKCFLELYYVLLGSVYIKDFQTILLLSHL